MPGLSLSWCGPAEIRSSLYDKSGVVLLRRFSLIWVWFFYIYGMIYSLLSLPGSFFWSDVFANRCRLMSVVPVVPVCVGWCRECRLMSVGAGFEPAGAGSAGGAGSCRKNRLGENSHEDTWAKTSQNPLNSVPANFPIALHRRETTVHAKRVNYVMSDTSHAWWWRQNQHSLCYIEKIKTSLYNENPTPSGPREKIITKHQPDLFTNMPKYQHQTAPTGIIRHQPARNWHERHHRHQLARNRHIPTSNGHQPAFTVPTDTNRHNRHDRHQPAHQHHPAPIRKNIRSKNRTR